MFRSLCLGLACVVVLAVSTVAQAADYTKPKVRAITAFVRLTPPTYVHQIGDALIVLSNYRCSSRSRDLALSVVSK
jgi:hypothetical protein